MEQKINDLETALSQKVETFHRYVAAAAEKANSTYPMEAKPFLANARTLLRDIGQFLGQIKTLKDKVAWLAREEERLLKHEKRGR